MPGATKNAAGVKACRVGDNTRFKLGVMAELGTQHGAEPEDAKLFGLRQFIGRFSEYPSHRTDAEPEICFVDSFACTGCCDRPCKDISRVC